MSQNSFDQRPVIIGHRGAAGLLPENTLPGFIAAVEHQVQAVELDVHLCEGELVVIHDPTLERTTSGTGEVGKTPLAVLRTLDAGNGAQIPTLSEVFGVLPERVGVNIELKGAGTAAPVAEWLPPACDRAVLISSFDHAELGTFHALRQDYPAAPLFSRWRPDAVDVALGFEGGFINLSRKAATAERLERINAAGLKALVYTVNDPLEARNLMQAGAWGLFTDFPDRINRLSLTPGR
jgi:glycerophosphoryl diester phosphodiesterase